MIYNKKGLDHHNAKFYNSFVDLKVVGWKSYAKALNDYTFNFYKSELETMTDNVEKFADFISVKSS